MRKVYDNIYLIEIPLRGNPLKSLNSFIIKGEGTNLIVDTGFNTRENQELILKALDELEIDLNKTILFLTHSHADHTGLASFLEKKGVRVYVSAIEGKLINDSIHKESKLWKEIVDRAILQGLGEDNLTLEEHPGYKFRPVEKLNYTRLEAGEELKIGPYTFEAIDLKGHTPGLLGLYERKHKIFFCGDHILGRITPNITFWGFEYGDMLGEYYKSLDKVYNMDIDYLFSSHRELIDDYRTRIGEIKNHHEKRLEETREILRRLGKSSVRTVAKNLQWDIRSKNWGDFPSSQKWFAAGEAHAHLERLGALGEVDYDIEGGLIYYRLA